MPPQRAPRLHVRLVARYTVAGILLTRPVTSPPQETKPMSRRLTQIVAAALLAAPAILHADGSNISWKKIPLTDKFYSEGASAGDFNKDGKMDVVYGPFWWAGPDFKQRHQIFKPTGKEAE